MQERLLWKCIFEWLLLAVGASILAVLFYALSANCASAKRIEIPTSTKKLGKVIAVVEISRDGVEDTVYRKRGKVTVVHNDGSKKSYKVPGGRKSDFLYFEEASETVSLIFETSKGDVASIEIPVTFSEEVEDLYRRCRPIAPEIGDTFATGTYDRDTVRMMVQSFLIGLVGMEQKPIVSLHRPTLCVLDPYERDRWVCTFRLTPRPETYGDIRFYNGDGQSPDEHQCWVTI